MSNKDKDIYINRQRERYSELVSRKLKTMMTQEVMEYLCVSRNHAIRCLNGKSRVRRQNPGPVRKYVAGVDTPFKTFLFLGSPTLQQTSQQSNPPLDAVL